MQTNLFDCDRAALEAFFAGLGEPAYRATQVLKWLYHQSVRDIQEMTNLSKALRQKLAEVATIDLPEVRYHSVAEDGTQKWLIQLHDNNLIETVYIPDGHRGTLCVSSQVGCTLNCSFCSTGKQGFNRNLATSEIIGQVWLAHQTLRQDDHPLTNVVMMGMGEPLYNFDNVVPAMSLMMDDLGYGLSKRRVTLSTAGVVPKMQELRDISDVALAVSLHAPNDALRDVLVPLNRKYPIKELMQVCKDYYKDKAKRSITFEYVMLDGVNDQDSHARELAKLLKAIPCKVNLIPFNPFPKTQYRRSSDAQIARFTKILFDQGIRTLTRKTRGDDIDAACGQLVGNVKDKTKRSERWQRLTADHQQASL